MWLLLLLRNVPYLWSVQAGRVTQLQFGGHPADVAEFVRAVDTQPFAQAGQRVEFGAGKASQRILSGQVEYASTHRFTNLNVIAKIINILKEKSLHGKSDIF